MKLRIRILTDNEVVQATCDGRLCLRVAAPGWEHDPLFSKWGVLEQWDHYHNVWVEIETEVT